MGQNKTDPTAALEHNRALLEQVIHSPDAQRLMELLNRNAGGKLKTAAASAALGDTKDLLSMVRQVMADPEGAKLVERLNQTAPKQS
ncbi:hypothetical protein [Flavonifractor plautii]|uniref:Uncharacterized protein n=1 Tax=Candidatus Flavonifractor intestinigallinarum TaxID=2838586 RepID=A0A9D2ML46_9FIRM|nr:hypothetical protein [Flavonifractor plautii]MBM6666095.1 hypothetical protein [Flavonifractor plautii]HJB80430.1 hypothetical protein [Candidatus Flavonifractor intestinigallinarum]